MNIVKFTVHGVPAPQGSKSAFVNPHTGRAGMRESSQRVRPWREAVKTAILATLGHQPFTFTEPAAAEVAFVFVRPKSHYRTGRNAHLLRDNAPTRPVGKNLGDIDKLLRATFDALTDCRVLADDSLVVEVHTSKEYGDHPGATIEIRTARTCSMPTTGPS